MRFLALVLVVNILLASILPVMATQQKQTVLDLEDKTFRYENYENLTAILTDEQGNALNNKAINFYVNTSVGWHLLGSSITNESGVAFFTMFVTMINGTYQFKAEFNGDSTYISSRDVANITVVDDVLLIPILIVVAKAMIVAVGTYLAEEYIAKPYIFPPIANCVKNDCTGISLPWKSYYDDPEEVQTIVDIAMLAVSAKALFTNGHKAAIQYAAAQQSTGKAVGVHMRWFWDSGTKYIGEYSGLVTGIAVEEIDKRVFENEGTHLTEDEKNKIKDVFSSYILESNNAFLQKVATSTLLDSFAVDPIIGYTETISVHNNIKRMRIYLGWNESEYSENFFILEDPNGNTVTPRLNVTFSTDPEAMNTTVELTVQEPLS